VGRVRLLHRHATRSPVGIEGAAKARARDVFSVEIVMAPGYELTRRRTRRPTDARASVMAEACANAFCGARDSGPGRSHVGDAEAP
jgi:hypothetical protein